MASVGQGFFGAIVFTQWAARLAVIAWGAVTQTHGFFIRGSVIDGESISSRASAVINQTAIFLTAPVAWLLDRKKLAPQHSDGFLNSSGGGR